MSVLATIDVAAEDFVFGGILTTNPGMHVRLESVVPLGSTFLPYVWAKDGSVDAVEAALRAEDDIESFRVVDTVDEEALIRVEWARDADGFLGVISETGATILEGEGGENTWRFHLRFDEDEDLTSFYRRCVEHGISIDLRRVSHPGIGRAGGSGQGITDQQREALDLAFRRGYFEVPRKVTLTELANELDVSDTAVSQRIRRGLTALLETTFETSGTR